MNSSQRRRIAAGALLAAATMVVTTACGGGNGSGGDKGKGGAPGFNAGVNQIASPSDKKGGELKFIASQEADSWDPARTYTGFVFDFARYYTRQLVTYKPVPGAGSAELVPDLATDTGKVSADGLTYTFTLKDGATWEDGKPITSKDLKYGMERTWAQDVISGGPIYLQQMLDPKKTYPGPYKDTAPDKLGLSTIQTPDDKTIVFKLAAPNGDFLQMLALPMSSPVRQDKDTKAQYGLHPFSSGPYKWDSYTPNKSLKLVRNDKW
ncbi:ABC transporter substrate-binding protein, partial [Streptomyces sp. NPDC004788]